MSKTAGFFFRELQVHGRKKDTAKIELRKGLNVVSGASDTGKSYLVQCLDFMTGAMTPPEEIDEAKGYETVFLEISSWKGDVFTLERSLRGGDFTLYQGSISEIGQVLEQETLKEKQRTKSLRTVSDFYLQLCELSSIVLLTKKKNNETKGVTFRPIAHLAIVDEERIYTRRSPIHAGSINNHRTLEESLFRFLVTGVDDSSLVSNVDQTSNAADEAVRRETILGITEALETEIADLTDFPDEIDTQLKKLKSSLEEITAAVEVDQNALRRTQDQRRKAWKTAEETAARLEVLDRLTSRFELLEDYYSSDLNRLGAMREAGDYMTQLPVSDCPVCRTPDPWDKDEELEVLTKACERERARTSLLMEDLASTMEDIEEEKSSLSRQQRRAQRTYQRLGKDIELRLEPATSIRKTELDELLDSQRSLDRAVALRDQLTVLNKQLDGIGAKTERTISTGSESVRSIPKTSETSDFCRVVEKLLKDWKFPDAGRVSFSETKKDIVINGKDRSSHGKGIRALSHSAFVVGLLRYCRSEGRPYPGVVVLDSPLVAYREPDSKKSVTKAGVKENFFRSLAKKKARQQIVVFENEDPPEDLESHINYVHFSGDKGDDTREGFFPNG